MLQQNMYPLEIVWRLQETQGIWSQISLQNISTGSMDDMCGLFIPINTVAFLHANHAQFSNNISERELILYRWNQMPDK